MWDRYLIYYYVYCVLTVISRVKIRAYHIDQGGAHSVQSDNTQVAENKQDQFEEQEFAAMINQN